MKTNQDNARNITGIFYAILPIILIVAAIILVYNKFKNFGGLNTPDNKHQTEISNTIISNTGASDSTVKQDAIMLYQYFNESAGFSIGSSMAISIPTQEKVKIILTAYLNDSKKLAQLYAEYGTREHNERHSFIFSSVFNNQNKNLLQCCQEFMIIDDKPNNFAISIIWRLKDAISKYG